MVVEHYDTVLGPQPRPAVQIESWREEYRPMTETVEVSFSRVINDRSCTNPLNSFFHSVDRRTSAGLRSARRSDTSDAEAGD